MVIYYVFMNDGKLYCVQLDQLISLLTKNFENITTTIYTNIEANCNKSVEIKRAKLVFLLVQ